MDIRDFKTVNPTPASFRGLDLTYNADAFTGDFLRRVAATFREMFGETKPVKAKRKKPRAILEATANHLDRTHEPGDIVESTVAILEETANRLDRTRDFYARILAGTDDVPVLMAWDLTDKGEPVPCTEAGMKCLEGRVLQDLYEFIRDHPLPKSPEIPTTAASQTISETIDAGSPTPAIPLDENQATSMPIA